MLDTTVMSHLPTGRASANKYLDLDLTVRWTIGAWLALLQSLGAGLKMAVACKHIHRRQATIMLHHNAPRSWHVIILLDQRGGGTSTMMLLLDTTAPH